MLFLCVFPQIDTWRQAFEYIPWLLIPGDTTRGVEKEDREGKDIDRVSDPASNHCRPWELDAPGANIEHVPQSCSKLGLKVLG